MNYSKNKSKKNKSLVVAAIAATGFLLALLLGYIVISRNDTNTGMNVGDDPVVEKSDQLDSSIDLQVYGLLDSADAHQAFMDEHQEESEIDDSPFKEGAVLLPVEFYVPAGYGFVSAELDGNSVAIVMRRPAKGCSVSAVQRKHIVFVEVGEDFVADQLQPEPRISLIDNEASCPVNVDKQL